MCKTKWLKFYLMDEAVDGTEGGAGGAASEPADSSTEDLVNWSGMAEEILADDETDTGTVEGDVEVVEPPAGETPPAAAAPETPPATPTPPASPTPAPAAQETPQTPTPQPVQAVPAADPNEYATWRETRLGQLAEHYAVEEADATALLTEPEKVLPKLAARVHMEVLESSMRAMQAMMPVVMQQIQQHNEVNTSAQNLFYSVNQDLRDPKLEPAIMQLGQVYRNVNPNAGPEEAARAIGALVRSALGMAQGPAPVMQTPSAPAAAPVPFTPARGGGGGNTPIPSSNAFSQLAEEFLQEGF